MKITRRGLLAASALSAGGLGAGLVGLERWCTTVESENLELTRKQVPLPHLYEPVRVLHIADFHLESARTLTYLKRAFDMGLAQEPDFVCISGDFITDRLLDSHSYAAVLRRLPASCPTYAVTGNHDGGVWSNIRGGYRDSSTVRKLVEDSGIELLHNRSRIVEAKGQRLRLVGVADYWAGDAHPEEAFGSVPSTAMPSLCLAHNPDYKDELVRFPWHLLLVGHTHGGQWRIPILNWAPYVPIKDRRFLEGLHRWNGRLVHVTRGVGSILHSRLNCRPEVSILDLVPERKAAV